MRKAVITWLSLLGLSLTGCMGDLEDPGEEPVGLDPDESAPLAADDEEALPDESAPVEELPEPGPDDGVGEAYAVAAMLDTEERDFLSRINAFRVDNGLPKLRVSIALTRAADYHSNDMATHGCFSHSSCDGTAWDTRIRRYYDHNTYYGENVAYGYTTGADVFDGWEGSSGHRANMLGEHFVVIGISRVASSNGTYYWTTDFGGYRDAVLSAGFSTIASNGGFESSSVTTGVAWASVRTQNKWHLYAKTGGSAARSTSAAKAGSYGLRSKDPNPGYVSTTQLVKASNGVNYRVKAQARRSSGATGQALYLDFLDASYARISVVTAATGSSTSWTTVKAEGVSPAGTRYVRVILYGSNAAATASTFDWDDVTVEAY